MKVLVDGYNVLKRITRSSQVTTSERVAFITQLARYARIKHLDVILIFDGLPAETEHFSAPSILTLTYSGGHRSADDYIKEHLDNSNSGTTLLVSSDRELVLYAQEYEIPAIDADYFYTLVRVALDQHRLPQIKNSAELVKTSEVDNSELEALMMASTKKMPHKEISQPASVARKSNCSQSKAEKKLLHILKKL